MAITYNAGTNIITVTGYTEAVPCNLHDIKLADTAGGWGVVDESHGCRFLFRAQLYIGDGTIPTWFADDNVILTRADGFATASEEYVVRGKQNSHIKFKWSTIVCLETTERLWFGGAWGEYAPDLQLEYVQFMGTYVAARPHIIGRLTGIVMKNCNFFKNWTIYVSENGTFNRLSFDGADFTYIMTSTIDDIDLKNAWGHSYTIFGDYVGNWYNCTSLNATLGEIKAQSLTSSCYFINAVFDQWRIYWLASSGSNKIWRQYEFDLTVIKPDSNRTPISGASVKIWDINNNLVVDTTTDGNGKIATQILNYGYYDQAHGNTSIMQTPHKIVIKASNQHETIKKYMYMDYKRKETISMKKTQPVQICDNYLILQLRPESTEDDRFLYTKM